MDRIFKFLNKLSQKELTVVKDVLEKIKKGEMANLDMKNERRGIIFFAPERERHKNNLQNQRKRRNNFAQH